MRPSSARTRSRRPALPVSRCRESLSPLHTPLRGTGTVPRLGLLSVSVSSQGTVLGSTVPVSALRPVGTSSANRRNGSFPARTSRSRSSASAVGPVMGRVLSRAQYRIENDLCQLERFPQLVKAVLIVEPDDRDALAAQVIDLAPMCGVVSTEADGDASAPCVEVARRNKPIPAVVARPDERDDRHPDEVPHPRANALRDRKARVLPSARPWRRRPLPRGPRSCASARPLRSSRQA